MKAAFRNWLIEHDNKILFVVLYAGLSLVLTLCLGLFWLLIIVAFHFMIEIIRHSFYSSSVRSIVLDSIWETKTDFALVLLAVFIAVYLDEILGMAGLGAAARTGTQCASRGVRFLSYQRTIRAIILTLDEMAIAIKAICCRKKPVVIKKTVHDEIVMNQDLQKLKTQKTDKPLNEPCDETMVANPHPSSWKGKWTTGDYISMSLFTVCFVLIVIAPLLLESYPGWNSMFKAIAHEFHPFAYVIGK